MKNTMKKFLSLVLVIIITVCAIPVVYAEDNTYKVGDIIQFGSYPQTEVKDEALIVELNTLAPEWEDWTSYRYYSGSGDNGTMIQGDWMRYTDIIYNGNKYRGVMFTQYRPNNTFSASLNDSSNQDENGYLINTIYWFIYEPISWQLLDPKIGLIISQTILDAQPYSNFMTFNNEIYKGDPDIRYYSYFNERNGFANDYETSFIRYWLNNTFYDVSFSDIEKNYIYTSTISNYCYHYLYDGTETKLDGSSTIDKVYLLSYDEAMNAYYGFTTNEGHAVNRRTLGSDYSKIEGINVGTTIGEIGLSPWYLRTPGARSQWSTRVGKTGYISAGYEVCEIAGIRPVIRIDLSSFANSTCNHKNVEHLTEIVPTCTESGFTSGAYCNDCEAWISGHKTIPVASHKDENSDYKCDYNCGYEFEKPVPDEPATEPSDPTDSCNCNCHAGGIKAFFFKLINFFQKLFGKNKVCACGAAH